MTPWNMLDLDKALRASWAADTCSPDNQADWQPRNPAWGHCDITALIVNDIFGGDLMVGEVHLDGDPHGFHWWNRLPSGIELDLTHEQFQRGQTVTATRVVERPPGPLPRRWEEYLLLRNRVIEHLGHLPEPVVRAGQDQSGWFSGTTPWPSGALGQPQAGAFGHDDVGVVQEPVDGGGGQGAAASRPSSVVESTTLT